MHIDPEIGVHVFEVKGMTLDGIEEIEAGGHILIRYYNGPKSVSPIAQVRNAMFDIKDATARTIDGDVRFPFEYWVIFPQITRQQWFARFGPDFEHSMDEQRQQRRSRAIEPRAFGRWSAAMKQRQG